MATTIRNKYHIAINTVGYMLRGAPNSPAYTRSVVPSQVNRLAISDLNYSDFAGTGLFYTAQTDWSAGIKSEYIWRDDAKYYYSTNIDAFSSQGKLSVTKTIAIDQNFNEAVYCAESVTVDGTTNSYVGTYKTSGGNIKIYKYASGSWSDVAGTEFNTSQNAAAHITGSKDTLWVGTVGTGNNSVLESYDGTSWTDHSADIITAMSWSALTASRAAKEVGGILYVGVEDFANDKLGIVSSDDNGATWTIVKNFGYNGMVTAMEEFQGKLYYFIRTSSLITLRVFDPATSTDIFIRSFYYSTARTTGVWNKLLKQFNGKLIISTDKKIYEYDGADLIEIFKRDDAKIAIGYDADYILDYGCVEYSERLYWANLVYDGESFYNFKRPLGDDNNYYLYPLFINSSGLLEYKTNQSETAVYKEASTYKFATASNYIIFNEMSPVVSIDKLLYSVTLMFDKMVASDVIKVEYSINNRSTWVEAATLTYASEGGTSTKREIVIPGNILFNKIWWRVSMANTAAATSPVLSDLIMAYRPMPNYKNRWQMRLNMSDGVKLLNKQNDDREGDDMNSQLWNEKLAKRQVKFQDIDYAECTLKTAMSKTQTSALITSVKKLPEQGRLRAVSGSVAEEMYYTSAKADRIMGITRGARGTTARAYLSGQVLDNGYDVYVEDITTSLNFTDEEKTESVAQVLLIES